MRKWEDDVPQSYELRGDQRTSANPKQVMKRPECAARIAFIASCSAALENALVDLAAMASATDLKVLDVTGGPGAFGMSGTENAVARAILSTLTSMRARLDAIEALIEVSSPMFATDFEQLGRRVMRVTKRRNEVVHAVWAVLDDLPDSLLLPTERPSVFIRYTLKDFDQIAAAIIEVIGSVEVFSTKCWQGRLKLTAFPPAHVGPPPTTIGGNDGRAVAAPPRRGASTPSKASGRP